MSDQTQNLSLAHQTRKSCITNIQALAPIIDSVETSPRAKLHIAHAIAHLAQTAAALTQARAAIAKPGGAP